MGTKTDVYTIVTEKVIAALEAGTVPWHKPWNSTDAIPKNLVSGKAYRGINPFLLTMASVSQGYESPYWVTFKQAKDRGGTVRKGERSSLVVFWKLLDQVEQYNPETGKTETKRPMVLRYYRVFNVEQTDDVAYPSVETVRNTWDPIEQCESIASGYLQGVGPSISYGGDQACYSPSEDRVSVPDKARFTVAEEYYSTLFHELTHSTGHESRLKRKDLLEFHFFGDANYSREELVAEMGSAMLCGVTGIEQVTVANSASYIASWLRKLRGDKKLVVTAAGQAQKAADMIRGIKYDAGDSE